MASEAKVRGRPPSSTDGAAAAVNKIKSLKKRLKITDEALAEAIGVDQTSVTRALSRKVSAWTPSMQKLWKYAVNKFELAEEDGGPAFGELAEDTLRQAVLDAWDGTPDGLNSLVRVLATLRDFRRPNKVSS